MTSEQMEQRLDEISKTINVISTDVALIKQELKIEREANAFFHSEISDKFLRIEHIFQGNGQPGLLKDVDRNKKAIEGWTWNVKMIWSAIIVVILNAIYSWFK